MADDIKIIAASYAGPEGYGNSFGFRHAWNADGQGRLNDPGKMSWPRGLAADCPRFGRMDALSKACVLAAELLADCFPEAGNASRREIGVGLETAAGSLGSDARFMQTGSPSVFVYTLPSSAIGEICIRHRFMGPVACLVSGAGGSLILAECLRWLRSGEARAAVCLYCDALAAEAARLPVIREAMGVNAAWNAAGLYLEASPGSERFEPVADVETDRRSLPDICRSIVCAAQTDRHSLQSLSASLLRTDCGPAGNRQGHHRLGGEVLRDHL